MKVVDKDKLEFQMYGYKGRFNKTNKQYKELKEQYNQLEKLYKNTLNNCIDLNSKIIELEIKLDKIEDLNKKIIKVIGE